MERDTITFNGIQFVRYPNSRSKSAQRYYYAFIDGRRAKGIGALHQEVWKAANGPIPKGFDIHHGDENPLNNALENLECISKKEHSQRHREAFAGQRREWAAQIRHKAVEWHRSPEGREWHKGHGKRSWEGRQPQEVECNQCHSAYSAMVVRAEPRFCSLTCRNRWHHQNRTHFEDRQCAVCGATFNIKKSKKQQVCSRRCSWAIRRQ